MNDDVKWTSLIQDLHYEHETKLKSKAIHEILMTPPPSPPVCQLTEQAAQYPVTRIYESSLLIHELVTREHANRYKVEKS
jgi:hypothetical protein